MRILKAAYTILVTAAFAIFSLLCMSHHLFYGFFNIFFLLLSPIAYIYPSASPIMIGFSWLVGYPVSLFAYGMDPVNSFIPLCIFNCLLLGLSYYRGMVDKDKVAYDMELKEEEADVERLLKEQKILDAEEARIREREIATANLYVITKKMSESLAFDNIFKIFSSFLRENFAFERCDFVVMGPEGAEMPQIEAVYSVLQDGVGGVNTGNTQAGVNYAGLAHLLAINPRNLRVSREADEEIFTRLNIKDKNIETLLAIPLLDENKVVAYLAIENLPAREEEKFSILAIQFAFEIQKIFLYETVERLAITDSLTGLYARRYFFERVNEEAQRSKRYKFKFAFLMCDIDNFKKTNDAYGHLVGDVVLKDIARIMKENVREIDLVSRYGGEEFALILPETSSDGAKLVAERIRKRIEEHEFRAYDEKPKVTISIGFAIYPKDGSRIRDLIEKADRALYTAKKSGKNVVCEYEK